jgi:hypothetical protein
VNPVTQSSDSDPAFVTELYKNLKILSQDLFRKTNAPAAGDPSHQSQISPKMERRNSMRRNSFKFAGTPAAQEDPEYYTSANLLDRVKQYAAEGGIPMEFVERYSEQLKTREQQNK